MNILKLSTYKEIIKFNSGIRNRLDLVSLLLGILDINSLKSYEQGNLKIVFMIEQRNTRVFVFENENSIHSFCFPFIIKKYCDGFVVTESESFLPEKIDDRIISFFKSIFNERNYEADVFNKDFISFFDVFDETYRDFFKYESDINITMLWNLYVKLISFEPCYIRYDHDIERADEKLHPLNHFDLNYSSNATFKIGLKSNFKIDNFMNFFLQIRYLL